jgi:hypothetical protein
MFVEGLTAWGLQNQGLVQNSDIHGITYSARLLCWFFQNIHDSVCDNEVEADQRRGVDDMVKLAFSGRVTSIHKMQ